LTKKTFKKTCNMVAALVGRDGSEKHVDEEEIALSDAET
jgi:hypothetical protein